MSVVHKKLHRSDDSGGGEKWYLKIHDGGIFGPVDISVLADWAAQLRIAPGNQVSTDQANWQPAESLPELKMVWMAELPTGDKYGPFNVLAVPHLHKNGTLPSDAKLINNETGKTVKVHEILSSETGGKAEPVLIKRKEEKWESLYKEEKSARVNAEAKFNEETELLNSQLQEANAEIERIRQESTKRIVEQTKADKEKIANVSLRGSKLQDEIEALKKQIDDLTAKLKQSQSELTAVRDALEAERRKIAGIAGKNEEALKASAAELEEQRRLYRSLNEEKSRLDVDHKAALADSEDTIKAMSFKLDNMQKQVETQKSLYAKMESDESSNEAMLRGEAEFAQKARDAAEEELATLKARIQHMNDAARKERDELLQKLQTMEKKVENSHAEIARLSQEKESLAEKAGAIERGSGERVNELTTALSEATEEVKRLRLDLSGAAEHNAALKKRMAEIEEADDSLRRDMDLRLAAVREESTGMADEIKTLRTENEVLRKTFEESAGKLKEAVAGFENERDTKKKLSDDFIRIREELNTERLAMAQMREKIQENDRLKAQMETRIESIRAGDGERLERFKQENVSLQSDLDAVRKEMESAHVGFEKNREEFAQKESALNAEVQRLQALIRESEGRYDSEKARLNTEIKTLAGRIEDYDQVREKTVAGAINEVNVLKSRMAAMESDYRGKEAKLRDEIRSLSELKLKMEQSVSDGEIANKGLQEKAKAAEDDLKRQVKHLQDVSDTSAGVIEKLNGQILKYRGEYHDYQLRIEKLMAEVETKKKEISDLSRKFEPMLNNAQRHEKELLKKVAVLESERNRAVRPSISVADKARDIAAGLRKGLCGSEEFLSRFPYIARFSSGVAIVVVAGLIMFWFGAVAGRGRPASSESSVSGDPVATDLREHIIARVDRPEPVAIVPVKAVEVQAEVKVAQTETAKPVSVEKPADMFLESDLSDLDLPPVGVEMAPAPAPVVVVVADVVVKPEWPDVTVKGVRVDAGEKSMRIIFDEAVFRYMTVVSEPALQMLGQVADQVRGSAGGFKLIVEGHTDSVPVSSQASVQDNYALGMDRARVISEILHQRFNLPVDFIIPVSVGEKNPPFSNDDEVERKKNRTVVLELVPD